MTDGHGYWAPQNFIESVLQRRLICRFAVLPFKFLFFSLYVMMCSYMLMINKVGTGADVMSHEGEAIYYHKRYLYDCAV